MAAIASFLMSLPQTWRALTALGGAAAIGATVAMLATAFTGLPAQVAENTDSIRAVGRRAEDNRAVVRRVEAQYDRIICLLTLPDSTPPIQAQRACP